MSNLSITSPGAIASLIVIILLLSLQAARFYTIQVGRAKYSPTQRLVHRQHDCSVILPIQNQKDPMLDSCVRKILQNYPQNVYLVLVGVEGQDTLSNRLQPFRRTYYNTQLHIGAVNTANKRRQIAHAMAYIDTALTVVTDQDIHWPSNFLDSALAPFSNRKVGAVTVPKIVRKPQGFWASLPACLFSCYYSLVAEESRAFNALDSSALFAESTVAFRTRFSQETRFNQQFENDPCLNRWSGTYKADEYLFFNRYFLQADCDDETACLVVFQDAPEATVQVEGRSIIGFLGEYLRTTRNTWRLSRSMIRRNERRRYPYAFIAMWLSSFVSFTMIQEAIIAVLIYVNPGLQQTWIFWIVLEFCIIVHQLIMGRQAASRLSHSGGKYNNFMIFMSILVGLLGQYVLELLKIVALFTAWMADVEKPKREDPEDPEAQEVGIEMPVWVNGRVQDQAQQFEMRNEPPWIRGFEERRADRRDPPPGYDRRSPPSYDGDSDISSVRIE
ncbi:hypothetical protein F53441_12756 [Fusarium austroafricanum]|uniref:Uncharacterized protein n=1 Tax=Fusarium austroafricanum TaxID=2364996 RepID=A0A8H4JXA6_9HYPO|nr:hypothetical protein F53441_12756 [Fusarium austroafricanum]